MTIYNMFSRGNAMKRNLCTALFSIALAAMPAFSVPGFAAPGQGGGGGRGGASLGGGSAGRGFSGGGSAGRGISGGGFSGSRSSGFGGSGFSGSRSSGPGAGGFSGGRVGGLSGSIPSIGSSSRGSGFGSVRPTPLSTGPALSRPSTTPNFSPSRSAPTLGTSRSSAGPSSGSLRIPRLPENPGLNLSQNRNISPAITPQRSYGSSANQLTIPSNTRPSLGSTSPRISPPNSLPQTGSRSPIVRTDTPGQRPAFNTRQSTNDIRPQTNLRPVTPNTANTRGQLSPNIAARATPNSINNFLSLNNRNQGGAVGFQRGGNALNQPGGRNQFNNSFNRLNVTQISHINNNIQRGFHNNNFAFASNNGFGVRSFGYGFGNPHWNNWCNGVRGGWNPGWCNGVFNNRFWATNFCNFPWQRSCYFWNRPANFWWTGPTWIGLNNWFPDYGWSSPNYYGYGPGGNVVYSGGSVLMNDIPIATAEDFAASAAELAAVPAPTNPDAPTEWLPLGTFALSESETDKDPSRVVQLAVDKEGIVSGTMFNKTTNQTFPIQGRVDKATQRVAFTIGEAKDIVFETGIYNLTQQQTPILVHGEGREETYLMLRLEAPKDSSAPATSPTTSPPMPAPPAPSPSLFDEVPPPDPDSDR